MERLISLLSIVVTLSIVTERIVEIIKGIIPSLSVLKEDPRQEARRRLTLQLMAVVSGVISTYLAREMQLIDSAVLDTWLGIICFGLLASGGSGFWNSISSYVMQAKDLKKTQVRSVKVHYSADPGAAVVPPEPVKTI